MQATSLERTVNFTGKAHTTPLGLYYGERRYCNFLDHTHLCNCWFSTSFSSTSYFPRTASYWPRISSTQDWGVKSKQRLQLAGIVTSILIRHYNNRREWIYWLIIITRFMGRSLLTISHFYAYHDTTPELYQLFYSAALFYIPVFLNLVNPPTKM